MKKRHTRRRVNPKKVMLCLLFLIGIVSVGYFCIVRTEWLETQGPVLKQDKKSNDTGESEDEYHLSLVMVGDNLIHDKIYQEAMMNGGGTSYDFNPMLEMIQPIVSGFDVAYYNQETILGGSEIGLSSYPAFNSPYEVGDAMMEAGFNTVSLATNHTLDRGEVAILNSRAYWDSKENVLAVGSYASDEDKNKIRIIEKNHITYTMLNYTYGTNGIAIPNGKDYLVNVWPVTGSNPSMDSFYQQYKEQVKKDIEAVRDKVDVLMVAMHWGIEYQNIPNSYQKDMAEYLESLGVDIIIGTHPHVIQPVMWINDTVVIYSLGNFLSAHEVVNMANRIGLMSSLEIVKKKDAAGEDKIQIGNLQNELLYTYYTSDYQNFLVVPFSKMSAQYLSNYAEVYEEYKKIVQGLDKNIYVVPINS